MNRSLGLAEDPGYAIRGAAIETVAADEAALRAAAFRNHPGLLALRAQERLAFAAVDAAVSDRYPSLGLQAQWGGAGGAFPLVWNGMAALQAAVQLFSAGLKDGRIDQSVADLRAARARVADMEQQLHLDLTSALNALDSARQRVTLTELTARQAAENLALVNERYRIGLASSVELTDAQVALTGAQAARSAERLVAFIREWRQADEENPVAEAAIGCASGEADRLAAARQSRVEARRGEDRQREYLGQLKRLRQGRAGKALEQLSKRK